MQSIKIQTIKNFTRYRFAIIYYLIVCPYNLLKGSVMLQIVKNDSFEFLQRNIECIHAELAHRPIKTAASARRQKKPTNAGWWLQKCKSLFEKKN